MTKVVFVISMSVDGFITAANRRPEEPMGDGGLRLVEWAMSDDQKQDHPLRQFWRKAKQVVRGDDDDSDSSDSEGGGGSSGDDGDGYDDEKIYHRVRPHSWQPSRTDSFAARCLPRPSSNATSWNGGWTPPVTPGCRWRPATICRRS